MRVRQAGVVLAISLLVPAALSAASRPPRQLHQVGDHWTAWNPPAPAETPETPRTTTYTIARGDTLWDLARRFYGNPYLWPQLWEKNQYILDAHWIYPGDPLVTGIQVAPVQNLAQAAAAGAAGPAEAMVGTPAAAETGQPEPPPQVAGVESAIKATSPPVGRVERRGNLGRNTAKVNLFTGDIVYLNGGGRQGLSPGLLFTIVVGGLPVVHPVTAEPFGSFYRYAGRVRVLSVQEDTAIAEIVHSCDGVRLGDRLQPFEPEPVPLGRTTPMRPVNLPVSGDKLRDAPAIVYARDNVISLGQDHVVFIDRGSEQNVTPGDVFTIYRANDRGLPPLLLGELAVLSVQKRSATAKITESRYTIFVGDRLDPK